MGKRCQEPFLARTVVTAEIKAVAKPKARPQDMTAEELEKLFNEYAVRADWCVKTYDEANHAPDVRLAHPEDLVAKAGEVLNFSAAGSTDPDGDALTYKWWQYREPGSYDGDVAVGRAGASGATLKVPTGAEIGQTLHIICKVTDTGQPPLTRYRRVVVTVR